MAREVEDKDLGWFAIQRAAAKADGLELRNGILDHRLRYPLRGKGKGQYIAKVAMIHQVYNAISQGYEQQRGNTDAAFGKLLTAIHAGREVGTLIHETIGIPIRDAMRAAVYGNLRRRTGRMAEAVRSTVFDTGGKLASGPGGRVAGYRGKVVAGDDPSLPKANTAV